MNEQHAHPDVISAEFAQGWYLVSWSADLGAGELQPLRYFGQDFVLFRGQSGRARLLDAHCPHLGAHFGHGGRIEGDELVCPFHAWRFDATGRCVDIPYAARIPPKAFVRAYPVREHSGMILAQFAPEGLQLEYEVPVLEEIGAPGWTPLACAQIEIRTQAREVIENIGDFAHFPAVHGAWFDKLEVIVDGPRATQRGLGRGRDLNGQRMEVLSVATYHGPAVQFTQLRWSLPTVLINTHIPIDEDRLLLRFGVALGVGEGRELPPELIETHVAEMRDGYFQDVAIWETKRWRDRPMLVDGDGPIQKIRDWYASFSSDALRERAAKRQASAPRAKG